MSQEKPLVEQLSASLHHLRKHRYADVKISEVEKVISQFMGTTPAWDDDEAMPDAFIRNEFEIHKLIMEPTSGYNKILPGYAYTVYLTTVVTTGHGGAKLLYKGLLREGMSEDMIMDLIYVRLDDGNSYPLSLLKIKENE